MRKKDFDYILLMFKLHHLNRKKNLTEQEHLQLNDIMDKMEKIDSKFTGYQNQQMSEISGQINDFATRQFILFEEELLKKDKNV